MFLYWGNLLLKNRTVRVQGTCTKQDLTVEGDNIIIQSQEGTVIIQKDSLTEIKK